MVPVPKPLLETTFNTKAELLFENNVDRTTKLPGDGVANRYEQSLLMETGAP